MDLISGLRSQVAATTPAVAAAVSNALSLEGRTAVVTGAASGIGRQTAATYVAAGARVVLADLDGESLGAVADVIDGSVAVPTDVTAKKQVDDLARAALRATGRIDVWANVAGIIRNTPVVDTTEDELDAVLAVNLKGVFWGCSAAGRVMSAAGRGVIVNVASAGGEVPAPTLAVYGMTKAAVIQLTRSLAAELGPRGVRVNTVAPGYVETAMTSRVWTGPDGAVDAAARDHVIGAWAAGSPLGRTGSTEDIAWTMLFLASDVSSFYTGQVLRPNGGVYMS